MEKKKRRKSKKLVYLMFCGECGKPKSIDREIIKQTFPVKAVVGVYCGECYHRNPIPDHLREIAGELTEGDLYYE